MEMLALLLNRLSALINQSLREDAVRNGLLPIHLQALGYLSVANRYSDIPVAVAEYLGITRGTMSQTLSLLERKGLLRKVADPHHGKRIHLKLTKAGYAVLNTSWLRRLDDAQFADSLGKAQKGLQDFLVALQRQHGNRAFGVCRQCAHFRTEQAQSVCGLTGETLRDEQTLKICREWKSP